MEPDTNTSSEKVPLRVTYNINRKVYNEEEFEQEHDQKMYSQLNKESESPKPGRKIQCRFSCARFKKFILKMFPILNWLYTYRITEWILGDIHAGLNVGMVQVFQGSFSILNAMAANFQSSLNFRIKLPINGSLVNISDETFMQNYMEAVTHTASTTFLVGIIQVLLGIIGLGFVTTYVSESLMNAYLTAAAFHVIISQFSFIFGIVIDFHAGPLSFFYNLVYYCMGLPKANSTSILLFLLSLLLLRVSKCIKITYKHYPIEFPMELVLDLIAIGLCNVFSSFFKTFSVSCAISTTVIQEKTGGKTQLAALIGISLMLVTGLKLGYYFQSLPNAVLAAIVLVNMFPFLEKFMDVPYLWKQDKYDFGIWIVTFLVVLCLGLDIGLGISLGFAFFIISVRAHRMKIMTLGQIPNTNIYRRFSDYSEAIEIQGVKIFQCCASISFANMKHFKKYILRKMDMKAVPLDENEMRALTSITTVIKTFENRDFFDQCVTKARFFPTLHDAILFAVEPTLLEEIVPVETQNAAPEDMMAEVHLDEEKDIRSYHSGRSKQSERRSQQSNGIRDAPTPKTVPSETYIEEPISDLFRTFSLQSDLEGTSHHPIETSPLEDNEDDQEWEGKWNYSRDV
ncbi:SLC26A8: Testis anion transporter 1 [Crotalus adamanteus]|uniref:SLC26A8: Testis anion transporter 1 n=1 Tax=Crotalus adamanteus TaxID=8729 RepID=A0AAW1BQJ0_CROAD